MDETKPNGKLVNIIYAVQKLGLPTVLSLVFVAMITGFVPSPLMEMQHSINEHIVSTDEHQQIQTQLLESLVRAQLATCISLAKDEEARTICINAFSGMDLRRR